MKKLAAIGLAITAMLAVTAVAVAQYALPVIQFDGTVTPAKGGSKKKPKSATLKVTFTVNKESHKTLSGITYFVPQNVKLSGKGFRYCPSTKINADHSDAKCPKGSKIGSGVAHAVLGPDQTPLTFNVTTYAGSKNEIAVYLKGIINIAFRAPINAAGAPFGQKIAVAIPKAVQQPAGGLYSYVTDVTTTIGGKATKTVIKKVNGKKRKVKQTYFFGSLTGCPKDGTHDLGVQLQYADNDAGPGGTSPVVKDTSDCSK